MPFVPAWTMKLSGFFFKKLSSSSKMASFVSPGVLFILTLWLFDNSVRNFIKVYFYFSSFSKNTIFSFKRSTTKPDKTLIPLSKSREAFCMLLLVIIASSLRCNLLFTESRNSLELLISFNKPSRFSSFCVFYVFSTNSSFFKSV